jgi:hypothetical protein
LRLACGNDAAQQPPPAFRFTSCTRTGVAKGSPPTITPAFFALTEIRPAWFELERISILETPAVVVRLLL